MNEAELKNLCQARGIFSTGRKKDIIDRFKGFDENGPDWNEIKPPIHIQEKF